MKSKKFLAMSASIVGVLMLATTVHAATFGGDLKKTDWWYDAAMWANGIGVVEGEGDTGFFNGGGSANRAHVVTMLMRYHEYLEVRLNGMQTQLDAMETRVMEMEEKMNTMMEDKEDEEDQEEEMAEEMEYHASLTGDQEVPAVNTQATAMADITLKGNMVTYKITVEGLTDQQITAAHFHMGEMGKNGDPIHTIGTFTNGVASGTWENMTDEQVKALMDGMLYVNVHTNAHPNGEIRGQVWAKPVLMLENVSDDQTLAGGLVVIHSDKASLDWTGQVAPSQVEAFAEWGDSSELKTLLEGVEGVMAVYTVADMKAGDKMEMVLDEMMGDDVWVSVIAMARGSNDGFALVDSMMLKSGEMKVAKNYDAGTEENQELNGGFAAGQYDATKSAEENMENGTATNPKENVALHDQLTEDLLKAMVE